MSAAVFGQVVSANCVGYLNGNMIPGEDLMTGAQFCKIGQEDLDLNTLVPECEYDYGDIGESYFTIKYYDPNDGKTYKYDWNIVGTDEEGNDVYGWFDRINAVNVADGDRVFSAGTGFWFYSGSDTETAILKSSGEVFSVSSAQEFIVLSSIPGEELGFICPIPVGNVDLLDIIPECEYDYGDIGESYFTIKYYDPNDGKTYKYDWNIVGTDEEGNDVYGWYDRINAANMEKGQRLFAAGEGFFLYSGSDTEEATLKIRNPFYTAK